MLSHRALGVRPLLRVIDDLKLGSRRRLGVSMRKVVARGKGAWLYDRDGRRYLDAISSWWVNLFGHANDDINAALKTQLDTLEHAMLAGCTHECAVELAERLSARTQGTLGHAFFASDGACAVEIALKMSFHAWRNRGRGEKLVEIGHGACAGAARITATSAGAGGRWRSR